MRVRHTKIQAIGGIVAGLAMVVMGGQAHAAIDGAINCSGVGGCSLYAESGYIDTPDGNQIYAWGFSDVSGKLRYPGPPIVANVGDTVQVSVTNNLPDPDGPGPKGVDPVSIVFAGQTGVQYSTDGGATFSAVEPAMGAQGHKESLTSMAPEATAGQTVIYRFTASKPGTYLYNSGTYAHKHIDMGLFGGLVVRSGLTASVPATVDGINYTTQTLPLAYTTPESAYQVEYLSVVSSLDPDQHHRVELGLDYEASAYLPSYWFFNGRAFPDDLSGPNVVYLPNQPDGSLVGIYPGERALLRMVNADHLVHPLHHHGNHATIVAVNGHEMKTEGSATADLSVDRFTQSLNAGQTIDGIFTWRPELDPNQANYFGWDVYGNDPAHPAPVLTPPVFDNPNISINYGDTYSGSPYLGKKAMLPGDVQSISINQHGEHYVPFHSHFENELENAGQRPGGMLNLIMICMPGQACYGH